MERRELAIASIRKGKLSREEEFRRLMELGSDELRTRCIFASFLQQTGDLQAAREMAWTTLKLHPASAEPYFQLAELLVEDPPQESFYTNVIELGFRKALRNPELLEALKKHGDIMPSGLTHEETRSLPLEDRIRILLAALKRRNSSAPAEVAARLQPFFLLDSLEEKENLGSDEVDAFLREGESMTPLLVGILRGWIHGHLRDESTFSVRNAIALLGEMGGPQEFVDVLGFCSDENEELEQAANWAVQRILQRMPEEAVRYVEEVTPEIGACRSALWAIALAPQRKVPLATLQKLTEQWKQLRKNECSRLLPLFFERLATFRGEEGVAFAREIFQRYSKQLSLRTRKYCQSLFELLRKMPQPATPEPDARTVYDLCAGMAARQVKAKTGPDFQQNEDLLGAPREVKAQKDLGRNDLCWCGSGKKYKKCHWNADQKAAKDNLASEYRILRRKISEFMEETISQRQKDAAFREYGCTSNDNEELVLLIDWMIHDWKPGSSGRTVIETFLQKRGHTLSAREREIAESWSRSFIALYEVQEVHAGKGVVVKNVNTGEQFFVHDVSLSKQVVRWDAMLMRVVEGDRGLECSGNGLRVPRHVLEPLRSWMEGDRRARRLPWPEYMKQNIVRIRKRFQEITHEWLDTLQLQNSDGDTLLFSKAIYEIQNEAALLEGLKQAKELVKDAATDAKVFVWVRAQSAEEGSTVVGTVTIRGRELTLNCNSKRRLDRGMELLANYAGASIRHVRNEYLSTQELRRRLKEEPKIIPPEKPVQTIPPEAERKLLTQAKEHHYAQWLDTGLPALGGRTPREAALTLEGKRKLTALLRDLENIEERARLEGKAAYDVRRLRRALDIEE